MATLVQEYLVASAARFPDRAAVVMREKTITFAELDAASNRLARFLKKNGVVRGDRVAFCLPKSVSAFVAIFGILKADAVYVPINHKAPKARIDQIIADAVPRMTLYDIDRQLVSAESSAPVKYENTGDDLAYILYTSGSTGVPKGVMIRHSNIVNATDWAVKAMNITEHDRMSQHPPLHFDLSMFDLYCGMASGATLYVVPEEFSLFPGQLLKFIEEKELTTWNSVPSVMVQMWLAGVVKQNGMPALKKVFFNGEVFPTKFLAEWMKTCPEKTFVNMYGPTETTVQCTFYPIVEIPRDVLRGVPIGKACANVEVFAVRDNGARAGTGEQGELYVGGRGVGVGYWNDPEKTARAFVPHPFDAQGGIVYRTGDLVTLREDGNYEFIGRKDNQVKVRGNRIELGDVDAALYSLPYVSEAATVVVSDAATNGNKLVAFVDFKDEEKKQAVKNDLAKLVPAYMIPDEVVSGMLPKTSHD